jgi:hypothetical protein
MGDLLGKPAARSWEVWDLLRSALTVLACLLVAALAVVGGLRSSRRSSNEEPLPQLSPAELARILGNSVDEDYEDDQAEVLAAINEEHDATAISMGEALLQAMNGSDSDHALEMVQRAGTTAVNFVDDMGQNALMIGCMEGHDEACRALLGRADFLGVNICNCLGSTVLHLAAGNDNVEICSALLSCPRFTSGVNAQNRNGQTALDFALEFGEGLAQEVLIAAGGRRATSGSLVHRRKIRNRWAPEVQEGFSPGDIAREPCAGEPLTDMSSLD